LAFRFNAGRNGPGCHGVSLGTFLAAQELLHLKLEGEPRDQLWLSYRRPCGIAMDVAGGMAFDTAAASAQYARAASGVFLGDFDMFAEEIASSHLMHPYDMPGEIGWLLP
jgi:hypothetical protein